MRALRPHPAQLSRELRTDRSPELQRRRWLLGLQLVGVAAGSIVGMFQMGMLRRLPDLPTRTFDATRVDASEYGYKYFQVPDGLFMIATYAVTAILTGAGGRDRARTQPMLPLALTGKLMVDVLSNLYLAKQEWRYNRAFCGYCQSASLASLASLMLSLPESRAALATLRAGA
jgi:uncharacterized membrane protein